MKKTKQAWYHVSAKSLPVAPSMVQYPATVLAKFRMQIDADKWADSLRKDNPTWIVTVEKFPQWRMNYDTHQYERIDKNEKD